MVDAARKQIEALFGNADSGATTKHFSDSDTCKYYLCGLCPYETFSGTKADLGECPKNHSLPLKLEYEEARKTKDYGYERELLRYLEKLISECDSKIAKSQTKLDDMEKLRPMPEEAKKISNEMSELVARAEQLGEEGKVEESLALLEQVEQLKKKKAEIEAHSITVVEGGGPGSSTQQKLKVCDICSLYLGLHDSDRRLQDHYAGKMHKGYELIRERLAELRNDRDEPNWTAEKRRATGDDRDKNRDRERDRNRPSSSSQRDRNRDRDDDVDRRRERDYDRDRERRGRDYHDRDNRDRDRDYRDRERDRDRDRRRY